MSTAVDFYDAYEPVALSVSLAFRGRLKRFGHDREDLEQIARLSLWRMALKENVRDKATPEAYVAASVRNALLKKFKKSGALESMSKARLSTLKSGEDVSLLDAPKSLSSLLSGHSITRRQRKELMSWLSTE